MKKKLDYEVGKLKKLGFLYQANGHNNIGFYVFLAENCKMGKQKVNGSETGMIAKQLSFRRLKKLIENGEITDGPTVAAFCLYLLKTELTI